MSGWDETRRVQLGEPWQDFWVDLWEDPPMGVWIDVQERAAAALRNPGDLAVIEQAIASFGPLVASHNLTDREGKPIEELTLRTLSSGLFRALLLAVMAAIRGEAAPANPTPTRAPSSAPSSPASPRRRATRSGRSPSG